MRLCIFQFMLAPAGAVAVEMELQEAGLLADLQALGFGIVSSTCTIGLRAGGHQYQSN